MVYTLEELQVVHVLNTQGERDFIFKLTNGSKDNTLI
jgi:hypothetical protein